MKIEIKERGKDSFYDEFLSVLSNYKKFIKNPNKKVHQMSKDALLMCGISLLMLIITTILFIGSASNELYRYISYFFSFLVVFSGLYFFIIKKRIKELKNINGTIVLDFNSDNIEYETSNNKYQVKWSAIKRIIIGKYSISFLPSDINTPVISVSRDYEDEVMKAIKECGHDELIAR